MTTLFGITLIPAIVGLVQVAKDAGIPSRFAPLVAVLIGLLTAVAQAAAATHTWIPAATAGVAVGLAACGLYDAGRLVIPAVLPFPTTPPTGSVGTGMVNAGGTTPDTAPPAAPPSP
jgi:hypothetical protein